MAVYSPKNEYQGINAHLQSLLQQPNAGWEGFHQDFTISLARIIDAHLPASYYAAVEKSLQIKTEIKPDVLIARRPELQEHEPVLASGRVQAIVFPEEWVEIETREYYPAILIYERGRTEIPVTRIEVLSPANKPPSGSYYRVYEGKRAETLAALINLVEIDFLHESPPLNPLKAYAKNYAVGKNEVRESQATPYHVAITKPLRLENRGVISQISLYTFGVDEAIPTVEIPLLENEVALADLNGAYQTTFESLRVYWQSVDYSQLPINFAAYSPADQDRIRARMQAVTQPH